MNYTATAPSTTAQDPVLTVAKRAPIRITRRELTMLEYIQAWGRMRRYYKELCVFAQGKEADTFHRKLESRIHHEKERIMNWILKAEKQIQIQFIAIPTEDWGGHNGY